MKNLKYFVSAVCLFFLNAIVTAHPGHHHEGSFFKQLEHGVITILVPVLIGVAAIVYYLYKRSLKKRVK